MPSLTKHGKQGADRTGFAYVHRDEALEMLIARNLKSLSATFLAHLESSTARLMDVSMFRALRRYVRGAFRSYDRRREANDDVENMGTLTEFVRNAGRLKTVARMVHTMREAGFLKVSHRGSEWILNVFALPPRRMNNKLDQETLLCIAESGVITFQLHASVLFSDLFRPLTANDRKTNFNDKKFKN
ncbi:hypothetical protein BWQ96_06481 [Gracilariopsis chorda]|uniref:Uncharacterized protein n=1 Tax=Gracilariopsis chorda TaxID=448386 RepID=A0A2V3INX0_9FLOR|nr:hypothetical protein BWQ96_06481 [Gracilariopsis chorda]|eukprot:PXF43749.1 hypothetical protein BWQ96_06481 [Gracilariopsis chorda]